MRAAAFPTSPSSCGEPCRRNSARASATTSSAATSARTSARGTAARRQLRIRLMRHGCSLLRWRNWRRSARPSSARCSAAPRCRGPATRASCETSPSPWAIRPTRSSFPRWSACRHRPIRSLRSMCSGPCPGCATLPWNRMRVLPLILFPFVLLGQQNLVDEGFDHFYNLEYDEAIACFEKAIARNPASPDLHNHLAQTLVFREMFRDDALESELVNGNNSFLRRPKLNPSPETEKQFLDEVAKAIELSEARLKLQPRDTGAMYAEGIAYGLRSNYFWVVRKAWR